MKFDCKEAALNSSPELLILIIHYIIEVLIDNSLYNIHLVNNILTVHLRNVEALFYNHNSEAKQWGRFVYELVGFSPFMAQQLAIDLEKH